MRSTIYIYIYRSPGFQGKKLKPESLDGVPNAFRLVELMEHVFPVEHGDFPKYDVSFAGVYIIGTPSESPCDRFRAQC